MIHTYKEVPTIRRILLVQAYLDRQQLFFTFPIGLATIAAYLTKEWEVKGFDPNAYSDPFDRLHALIAQFKPDVVGISLRNLDTTNFFDPHIYYNGFVKILQEIRIALPNTPVVVGGAGFSLLPQEIMEDNPELDYGIYLEGEEAFPELLHNLLTPEKVQGIYYRKNNQVHFSGKRPLITFNDTSPIPAWEIFDLSPYKGIKNAMGVETKRGCAYKCIYCDYFLLNGNKYRLKSSKNVMEEIKALRKLGFNDFCFTDSVFNTPSKHAVGILRDMKNEAKDMAWDAYLSPVNLTDEFVSLCLETGMNTLIFSPDSVTDDALQAMGKGMNMKTLKDAVYVIKRHPPASTGMNFFVNGPKYNYKTLFVFLMFSISTKLKLGKRYNLLKNLSKSGYMRV